MEKSPARVTRDLSAPWLRHSGRDDGGGVTSSAEMTVGGDLFGRDDGLGRLPRPSVISTVGSAGTGMEKSPARDD